MVFLFQLISTVVSSQVLITYSESTPEELTSRLSNHFLIDLSSYQNPESLAVYPQPSLIIDISFNTRYFYLVDCISEFFRVPYITLTKDVSNQSSKYRFFKFAPIEYEANALVRVINYLKWPSFNVLLSNTNENNEILSIIKSQFSEFQVKRVLGC